MTSVTEREQNADRRADRYRVEIHKKWSLSFASIPFVLIAVAMALRFPRGGMGLVLGGGMFVYSVFYVGLTAGETLADRGYARPGSRCGRPTSSWALSRSWACCSCIVAAAPRAAASLPTCCDTSAGAREPRHPPRR